MADLTEYTFRPFFRSRIRSAVRGRETDQQIRQSLLPWYNPDTNRYAGLAPSVITRMINQERGRHTIIRRLEQMDKRQRTNLHALVGCGRGEIVQTRITIQWRDPATGAIRHYGHTTTLATQGRLMDILNPALAEAITDATGRGYTPPAITSSMLSGDTRYRLEYIECVKR